MKRPAAIITDIEGTTTPIAFVRETLFPFARNRLADFVAGHRHEPTVAAAMKEACALAGRPAGDDPAAVAALLAWSDQDRKLAPLKTLQGLIWEAGYRDGKLKAPVYPDAATALRGWAAEGIALYVYSSGSVAAQKLLFGHSDQGDLAPLFADWFDLAAGPKLEAESYRKIASAIDRPAGDILFLSDHPGEIGAAAAAGLRIIRLNRGDPTASPPGPHPAIDSFREIVFDAR